MINRISGGHNISYKGNIKKQGYLPKIHIKKFSEQNIYTHATIQPACAPATPPEAVTYGSNLLRSRGNSVASRTFSSPISCIVSLSSPIPRPPCGGMPCLKAER